MTTTVKQSKSSHLKPYQFKPGQSGNPKGKKKSILTKKDKLQLLAMYAELNPEKANPVEAIREDNRLQGHYPVEKPPFQDNRVINIIVSSEKVKELTENISRRLLDVVDSDTVSQDIEEGGDAAK